MNKLGCEKCFNHEILNFESFLDFDAFDLKITKKTANGTIKLMEDFPNEQTNEPNYTIFKCNYCKTKWWLSEPDQAWRGYFLREQTAQVRMSFQSIREKTNHKGCLTVIFLLTSALLYFLCR